MPLRVLGSTSEKKLKWRSFSGHIQVSLRLSYTKDAEEHLFQIMGK